MSARQITLCLSFALLALVAPSRALGFSVLAHQAVIDRCWDDTVVPALRERFPDATDQDLERAHAFAYGGSHIADLGYFPFGSRLFTDLVHYARSGRFVAAMLEGATTVDEYAFAIGAASHYVGDTIGHAQATNRVVPIVYPELREEHGDVVTYEHDHEAHMQTEFRFDILQLAQRRQSPDLFRQAIAFEVSEPLLERAFRETYGLELSDVFVSTDIAITTYRWGFRALMQEATGIAWQLYEADIQAIDPAATAESFVGSMSREDFEKQFGASYREAGYTAKLFGFLVKAIPEVGPFERMPYKELPAEARERFDDAFESVVAEFRSVVERSRDGSLELEDLNLDTGEPVRRGQYEPADEAWAELVETLDEHDFAAASDDVRADIVRFFREAKAPRIGDDAEKVEDEEEDPAQDEDVQRALARLGSVPGAKTGASDAATSGTRDTARGTAPANASDTTPGATQASTSDATHSAPAADAGAAPHAAPQSQSQSQSHATR